MDMHVILSRVLQRGLITTKICILLRDRTHRFHVPFLASVPLIHILSPTHHPDTRREVQVAFCWRISTACMISINFCYNSPGRMRVEREQKKKRSLAVTWITRGSSLCFHNIIYRKPYATVSFFRV